MELGVEGRKLSSFDAIWRNLETLMPLKLGKSVFPTKITKLSFLSSTPLLPLAFYAQRNYKLSNEKTCLANGIVFASEQRARGKCSFLFIYLIFDVFA